MPEQCHHHLAANSLSLVPWVPGAAALWGSSASSFVFPHRPAQNPAAGATSRRKDVWTGILETWRMHRIHVTDQTVTSVQIIHYILKSLDTKGPVALFTISSCSWQSCTEELQHSVVFQKLSKVSTNIIIYLQIRQLEWLPWLFHWVKTTHSLLDLWYSLSCSV